MGNVSKKAVDVVLVGAGIMSATLGVLLKQLRPEWSIEIFETRSEVATESTNPWNNAGTGHAALCELNYMPEGKDSSLSTAKAVNINEQFQLSRQWWASLVERGILKNPPSFINPVPHMTFVEGEANVDYLRRRWELLKEEPLFSDMEFSTDAAEIAKWAPLLIDGREKSQSFAATRSMTGTDVNFGEVTRQLFEYLVTEGAKLHMNTQVQSLVRSGDHWLVKTRNRSGYATELTEARFVFVGAGGGALKLLQSTKIPEIRGYAGFPISGKFLYCDKPEIVNKHRAKVYGKAKVGAPPMSVPHLDTRVVDGKTALLFGPFAGFSPKFLKNGSWFDLPRSIRMSNLSPMMKVGITEFSLEKYLVTELLASREKQMDTLREYFPAAKTEDWEMITAGQRVQIMKKDPERGGILQFGTEVVSSADGTVAGLLGASPGASTAVSAMLSVLEKCFSEEFESEWKKRIIERIPSYGTGLNHDAALAAESLRRTAEVLQLNRD